MTSSYKMRFHLLSAVLAGMALRTLFIMKFPVSDAGDSPFYIELAWNWLKHGIYGLVVNGRLAPVDMRVPGYPAFLAGIFAVAGKSGRAVMFAQAGLDLLSCFATALIAARIAPPSARKRALMAGTWLAALCPFTANYTAAVLAETFAIFLTAIAILVLLQTEIGPGASHQGAVRSSLAMSPWFLAGILTGCGALVRPETPLLLLAAGLVLLAQCWRQANWRRLIRASVLMGLGLLLPLAPWAARNRGVLGKIQFLAPRYGELPGELAPRGFDAWTHTWLWRFRDVYSVSWKLDSDEIELADIPPSAFDSTEQQTKVVQLLAAYNKTLTLTPAQDRAFAKIARERTELHPLRSWVRIPMLRSLTMWFAPRIELLPYSGRLFPLSGEWEDDREDFCVSVALVVINAAFVLLAAAGVWIGGKNPLTRSAIALLLVFILVRTAFIAWFAETPEPRYVLECFPALLALAALAFTRGLKPPQPARDESSAGKFAETAL